MIFTKKMKNRINMYKNDAIQIEFMDLCQLIKSSRWRIKIKRRRIKSEKENSSDLIHLSN